MSKKDNIDKIFRNKSLSFQKEPPPEIWDNILIGIQPAKKAVLPVFWRIAAGIAIIIGIGLGYEYIFKTEQFGDDYLSENEPSDQNEVKRAESFKADSFSVKENVTEIHELKNIEKASSIKYNNPTESLTGNSTLLIAATDMDVEKSFLLEENKHNWINALSRLPIQINPQPAQKDSIVRKKFNIQYTWDDLLAEEDFSDKKKKVFLIEALLSPTYTYRDIVSSNHSLSNYYNEFESGQISYSGGMKIGFIASERISIHTGLVYSRIGYSIGGLTNIALKSNVAFDQFMGQEYNNLQPLVIANSIGKISNADYSSSTISAIAQPENADASLDYLSSGALLSPDNRSVISDLSFNQIFHVMEIPFLMKYKIVDRKIDFNLLSGFSTNILVGNNLFVNEGSERTNIGEMESVNSINYSGDLGIGLEYDINKKLQILFEPQFKYYLNSINKDNLITNRPYSLGFYTGLSYVF